MYNEQIFEYESPNTSYFQMDPHFFLSQCLAFHKWLHRTLEVTQYIGYMCL